MFDTRVRTNKKAMSAFMIYAMKRCSDIVTEVSHLQSMRKSSLVYLAKC